MRAPWLAALLATMIFQAKAELPSVVEVAIPDGGGSVRLALPTGLCGYPKEVRDRLAKFLAVDGVRLLGSAGDCAGIDRLMRSGRAMVSPSMEVEILSTEASPATRSTPSAYRRRCFERFPAKLVPMTTDAIRRSLEEADGKLKTQVISMGPIAATRDAVFGGSVGELSRDADSALEVQVMACFAPGDIPLIWEFQETLPRRIDAKVVADRLRVVLALAQSQVKATLALNRAGSRRR